MPADSDYDALPLAALPPFPLPAAFAPDNPEYAVAWRTLYGDSSKRVRRPRAEHGDGWPTWALDQPGDRHHARQSRGRGARFSCRRDFAGSRSSTHCSFP